MHRYDKIRRGVAAIRNLYKHTAEPQPVTDYYFMVQLGTYQYPQASVQDLGLNILHQERGVDYVVHATATNMIDLALLDDRWTSEKEAQAAWSVVDFLPIPLHYRIDESMFDGMLPGDHCRADVNLHPFMCRERAGRVAEAVSAFIQGSGDVVHRIRQEPTRISLSVTAKRTTLLNVVHKYPSVGVIHQPLYSTFD